MRVIWQTEWVSVADRPFISFVKLGTVVTHNVIRKINKPFISIEGNDITNMPIKTSVSLVTDVG